MYLSTWCEPHTVGSAPKVDFKLAAVNLLWDFKWNFLTPRTPARCSDFTVSFRGSSPKQQQQSKANWTESGIPNSLDLTLKRDTNCATFNKISPNSLDEKPYKSKVFHKMNFYSHLWHSYFITEKVFFFETIVLKKLIVFSLLRSHLSPGLFEKKKK